MIDKVSTLKRRDGLVEARDRLRAPEVRLDPHLRGALAEPPVPIVTRRWGSPRVFTQPRVVLALDEVSCT